MRDIAALAGGFLAGGFARWLLSAAIMSRVGPSFPWGTAVVNLSGCLAIGFIDGYAGGRGGLPTTERLALITGFCGAYTTFSSLILETNGLLGMGRYGAAALHYLGGGVLGLILFRAGERLAFLAR